MARKIIITLGILLLLVVGAALLIPVLIDKDEVLALAAEAVKEQTGATLTVGGELGLSIFPNISVDIADAAITLPDQTRPDLEIASASIGVQLMPLLSSKIEVGRIAVDGLIVRTQSSPEDEPVDTSTFSDAQLDDFYAERKKAREAANEATAGQAALAAPLALNVASLALKNVRIESLDTTTDETSVIEIAALVASDLNLDGQPIPLSLVMQVPGEQALDIELHGNIAVDQKADKVAFDTLEIAIKGATPSPLEVIVSGSFALSQQVADTDIKLSMGEVNGAGSLRYASFESPMIDADLKLNLFDPVLFALAGPEAAQSSDAADTATGDEPLPLDALRAVDTRAKLFIETARFDAHVIDNLQVLLRVNDGMANLKEIKGRLHGGDINGSAVFNGRHSTGTLTTKGLVSGLDIDQALTALESPGLVSGAATLDWELNTKGKTTNEMTAALSGPIKLVTEEVTLHGTSIEHMLCKVVALTNQEGLTATFSPDTRLSNLSADIQLNDGKARMKPLLVELAHAKLTGTGNFDLTSQDFSANFTGRLSPGFQELDNACRVSKRLTAVDFPVRCKGNIASEPSELCKVDSNKIVKDMAVYEGKRKLEKKAGKLFNNLFGPKDKDQE